MKEAVIKIDLQKGMEIMSEEELERFIRHIIARDVVILGNITEVSIKEKNKLVS